MARGGDGDRLTGGSGRARPLAGATDDEIYERAARAVRPRWWSPTATRAGGAGSTEVAHDRESAPTTGATNWEYAPTRASTRLMRVNPSRVPLTGAHRPASVAAEPDGGREGISRTRPWRLADGEPAPGSRVEYRPSSGDAATASRWGRADDTGAAVPVVRGRRESAMRDPQAEAVRRAWVGVAATCAVAMVAVIGGAIAWRPVPDGAASGSAQTIASTATRSWWTSERESEPLAVPTPIGAAPVAAPDAIPAGPTRPGLTPGALPLALSGAWFLGAWIVDREARRALVARGPWGERRTLAYAAVALVVVTPLLVGGVLVGAWGAVTYILAAARAEGTVAGWRATGVVAGAVVALLVLRHPVGGVARWLGGAVVRSIARVTRLTPSPRRIGVRAARRAAFATDLARRRGRA